MLTYVPVYLPASVRAAELGVGSDWILQLERRTAGKLKDRVDKYYYSPSGVRFRSKLEVKRYLEQSTSKDTSKPKERAAPAPDSSDAADSSDDSSDSSDE